MRYLINLLVPLVFLVIIFPSRIGTPDICTISWAAAAAAIAFEVGDSVEVDVEEEEEEEVEV